jgi:hypothetical protein
LILKEGFSKRFFKKSISVMLGWVTAINSARKALFFQKAAKDRKMDSVYKIIFGEKNQLSRIV